MHVRHLLLAVLPLREVVEHAALDRTRRKSALIAMMSSKYPEHLPEEIPHPARLELEDADRLRLLEESVRIRIVERERAEIDRVSGRLLCEL
jgi:hypothetical protein